MGARLKKLDAETPAAKLLGLVRAFRGDQSALVRILAVLGLLATVATAATFYLTRSFAVLSGAWMVLAGSQVALLVAHGQNNSRLRTRKEEAAAVSRAEARYRLLTDNATDAIARISLSGQLIYVSNGIEAMTGYEAERFKDLDMFDYIHPDDRHEVKRDYARLIRLGERCTVQYRFRHRDGSWVWIETSPCLLRDPLSGEAVEFIDVLRDVTARKAAEAALLDAQAEADAATRAKSEFLANMSHELRTPLNSIVGFAGLLEQDTELPERPRRHARLIHEASRALVTVVNDILDFSKLEAGGVEFAPRAFRLEELLGDTHDLLTDQAASKGVALVWALDGDPAPILLGDADRMRQVLLNLLSNGLKFTAAGQVSTEATLTAAGDGNYRLRVAVKDTGLGITADKQALLFQRFQQTDGSISRRYGGTGLGLAISKGLVEMMGGAIAVESEAAVGSTFWFELPLRAADQQHLDAAIEESSPERPDGLRLLIVDDLAANRELVRALLEPFDCEIDEAENGQIAVQAVQLKAYDLVLMDMQMPVMDGLTATRRIRALGGRYLRLPIVAATANVLPEQVALCHAAGMNDHVGKPFTPAELLAALSRWSGPNDETLSEMSATG